MGEMERVGFVCVCCVLRFSYNIFAYTNVLGHKRLLF